MKPSKEVDEGGTRIITECLRGHGHRTWPTPPASLFNCRRKVADAGAEDRQEVRPVTFWFVLQRK